MNIDWTEIAAAGVAALLGSGGFLRWYLQYRAKRIATEAQTAREATAADNDSSIIAGATQAILVDIIAETSAVRALFLHANHGPGNLAEADPPHITITAEARSKGTRAVREDWQERQTDADYVAVLRALVTGRELEVIAADLPDCELRRVYDADGIAASRVRLIGTTEEAIYYLSLGYPSADALPPAEAVILDTKAANLRALVTP